MTVFKNTKIGRLPVEWEVKKIGDNVLKVGSGVTPTGGEKAYLKNGIPLIRSQNVLTGKLKLEDVAFISKEQHDKMAGSKVFKNDVLLNITGASIGRCGIYEHEKEANVNQHVCIIRLKLEINPLYLCSFLNSDMGQKMIDSYQAGGNRQGLNFEQIKSLEIPIPPLPEQQKIAAILRGCDATIAAVQKLIAALQCRHKGLMQQLLSGKKRVKGFENEIWKQVKLGELGESIIGLTYDPKDINDDGILVLRSSNIQEGQLSFNNNVFVKMKIPQKLKVQENDILVCARNGSRELIGKCVLLGKEHEEMSFGAFMSIFRGKYNTFLIYFFKSLYFKKQVNENLGATINQITTKHLNDFNLKIPSSLAEQQKIASILRGSEREIALQKKRLQALQAQKKGLMQVLLTGKVRVKI